MKNVLIVDVETTGLDPTRDRVIELGCILWSVKHRSIVEVYSRLLPAQENPAEAVNGIPAALIAGLPEDLGTWDGFVDLAGEADAICAHQADFDRGFIRAELERWWPEREREVTGGKSGSEPLVDPTKQKTWICTREDARWPRNGTGESLIATALAHGVAVTSAHRAIHDCLLIARLFEAVPDIGERLEAAYEHAKLPKVRLVSLAPYEERETTKAHGFKWDPARREWWRVMAIEDAKSLPFRTRQVEV